MLPYETALGRFRWAWFFKCWDQYGIQIIDLDVSGGFDGSDLELITIKDHGGSHNARAIEAMARIYDGRGWRYDMMPRAGAGSDTRRIE